MNIIHAVIVIDTEGALSAGTLEGYVYMVDTNKYIGSWQEGQSDLHTVCEDGQKISWWAAPVNAGNSVSITGFSGQMVASKSCVPKQDILAGEGVWTGQVETQGSVGSFPYTVTLELGSKPLSFSGTLKVA